MGIQDSTHTGCSCDSFLLQTSKIEKGFNHSRVVKCELSQAKQEPLMEPCCAWQDSSVFSLF